MCKNLWFGSAGIPKSPQRNFLVVSSISNCTVKRNWNNIFIWIEKYKIIIIKHGSPHATYLLFPIANESKTAKVVVSDFKGSARKGGNNKAKQRRKSKTQTHTNTRAVVPRSNLVATLSACQVQTISYRHPNGTCVRAVYCPMLVVLKAIHNITIKCSINEQTLHRRRNNRFHIGLLCVCGFDR
jgi:hypothetical protein